jgi:F-type H+-transporting ATPase subunit b
MMVWTVLTFLILVGVLGRFAWKPLLKSIEDREEQIRADIKGAQEARLTAEALRQNYEAQLAQANIKVEEILAKTGEESKRLRENLLRVAREEAAHLADKTRQQLAEEQRRLVQELRADVVALSVKTTEKLLKRSVDKSIQDEFFREAVGTVAGKVDR